MKVKKNIKKIDKIFTRVTKAKEIRLELLELEMKAMTLLPIS
jgi:hypothetical protein